MYLIRLISDYLSRRVLCYETLERCKQNDTRRGVAQGSVPGPLLWNIMYDGILRLKLPKEVTLVAFAYDDALVITGKHIEDIDQTYNDAIHKYYTKLDDISWFGAGSA